MFKYLNSETFTAMTPKTRIEPSWNGMRMAPAPRIPPAGKPYEEGAALVMQYVEGYVYRTWDLIRAEPEMIDQIYQSARAEDGLDDGDYPSAASLMLACGSNGYVCNGIGAGKIDLAVGYVRNQAADLKYFLRQYGQLILETKITSTTYNQDDYEIADVGTNLNFDEYSKGFIMYGYDSSYIYIQNSRGPYAGSYGFHKMPWSIVPSLVLRGLCWKLENPA